MNERTFDLLVDRSREACNVLIDVLNEYGEPDAAERDERRRRRLQDALRRLVIATRRVILVQLKANRARQAMRRRVADGLDRREEQRRKKIREAELADPPFREEEGDFEPPY